MIRDILRTACVMACMTAGAALLVETRYQLAAIDVAHRHALAPQMVAQQMPQPIEEPGRLRQFGRSALNLADATLGIFR
jgi:HAMP domain-containing protein